MGVTMYKVGKHIDDANTGARLIIIAVEPDHVLCRVQRRRRAKGQAPSRENGAAQPTASRETA
ncbi:MAG: hypothetical protein QOF41_65 [Methylobacteriaceae bacterium]|nr:hypothetical protein [Methylobacteriaceae bacterium]